FDSLLSRVSLQGEPTRHDSYAISRLPPRMSTVHRLHSQGASRELQHAAGSSKRPCTQADVTRVQQLKGRSDMTTTPTQSGTGAQNATLKAYEDKVRAQLQEGKAKLDQLNAKAKEKQAQAELDVVGRLNATKQNIEKKLQDLKTTADVQGARAKADIDADVASFKSSINELAGKINVVLCIAAMVTAAMVGAVR